MIGRTLQEEANCDEDGRSDLVPASYSFFASAVLFVAFILYAHAPLWQCVRCDVHPSATQTTSFAVAAALLLCSLDMALLGCIQLNFFATFVTVISLTSFVHVLTAFVVLICAAIDLQHEIDIKGRQQTEDTLKQTDAEQSMTFLRRLSTPLWPSNNASLGIRRLGDMDKGILSGRDLYKVMEEDSNFEESQNPNRSGAIVPQNENEEIKLSSACNIGSEILPKKGGLRGSVISPESREILYSGRICSHDMYEDIGSDVAKTLFLGCAQIILLGMYVWAAYQHGRPQFCVKPIYGFYCLGILTKVQFVVGKGIVTKTLDGNYKYWARLFLTTNDGGSYRLKSDPKGTLMDLRKSHLWLRFLLSIAVNNVGLHIIWFILPMQLASSGDPFDFVLNAVAAYYITEMDDLAEEKEYELVSNKTSITEPGKSLSMGEGSLA